MIRNGEYAAAYKDVMKGYIKRGYVRKLSPEGASLNNDKNDIYRISV